MRVATDEQWEELQRKLENPGGSSLRRLLTWYRHSVGGGRKKGEDAKEEEELFIDEILKEKILIYTYTNAGRLFEKRNVLKNSVWVDLFTPPTLGLLQDPSLSSDLRTLLLRSIPPILNLFNTKPEHFKILVSTITRFWVSSDATLSFEAFVSLRRLSTALIQAGQSTGIPTAKNMWLRTVICRSMFKRYVELSRKVNTMTKYNRIMVSMNMLLEVFKNDWKVGYRVATNVIENITFSLKSDGNVKVSKDVNNPNSVALPSYQFIRVSDFLIKLLPAHKLYKEMIPSLSSLLLKASRATLANALLLPYSLHVLHLLLDVYETASAFIPVSSILYQLAETLMRQGSARPGPGGAVKDIELEYCFTKDNVHTIGAVGMVVEYYCFGLIRFLSYLSAHPSYPEVSFGLIKEIKKILKTSTSKNMFNDSVKEILKLGSETQESVREMRKGKTSASSLFEYKYLEFPLGAKLVDVRQKRQRNLETAAEAETPLTFEPPKKKNRGNRKKPKKEDPEQE